MLRAVCRGLGGGRWIALPTTNLIRQRPGRLPFGLQTPIFRPPHSMFRYTSWTGRAGRLAPAAGARVALPTASRRRPPHIDANQPGSAVGAYEPLARRLPLEPRGLRDATSRRAQLAESRGEELGEGAHELRNSRGSARARRAHCSARADVIATRARRHARTRAEKLEANFAAPREGLARGRWKCPRRIEGGMGSVGAAGREARRGFGSLGPLSAGIPAAPASRQARARSGPQARRARRPRVRPRDVRANSATAVAAFD